MYDIRDNKTYTIRKLADGNCWMTDNLAYELQAQPSTYEVNGVYVGSKDDGSTFQFVTGTYYSDNTVTIMNQNTHAPSTESGYTDQYYYNWYAATAWSGTAEMVTSDGDAESSICPAGWKLPTNYINSDYPSGGAPKSWGKLLAAYGMPTSNTGVNRMSKLDGVPLSMTRKGRYLSGTLGVTDDCHYWSSTAGSDSMQAYYLGYNSGNTNPQANNKKANTGNQIRCVNI